MCVCVCVCVQGAVMATPYSMSEQDVDTFANSYKDVLVVYAAGNSGTDGEGSVYSPCCAKNGIMH